MNAAKETEQEGGEEGWSYISRRGRGVGTRRVAPGRLVSRLLEARGTERCSAFIAFRIAPSAFRRSHPRASSVS